MNVRSLLILAGCAVAVTVVAYYAVQESRVQPPEVRLAVYDRLMEQVNSVSQITVSDVQTTTTVVRQENGAWVVQERDGYLADLERVRQAILGTARLELVEPRSSNSELYEHLWLRDVSVSDSKALRLTLNTQDGTILADFLRGKSDRFASGWRSGTLFLRKFGEEQTWLVSGRLSLPTRIISWLDSDMPKIEHDRIRLVEVVHPAGHSFRVERSDPAQEDFDIYPSPPSGMEIDRYEVRGLEHGFAFLSLTDVARVENVDFTDAIKNTAHTFDGLQMTISLVRRQEEWWIKFDADFEPVEADVEADDGNQVAAEQVAELPVLELPAAEPLVVESPAAESAIEVLPEALSSVAKPPTAEPLVVESPEVVTADDPLSESSLPSPVEASDGGVNAGLEQDDPLVAKDEIEPDIGSGGDEISEVPVEQVAQDDTTLSEVPDSDSLSLEVGPAVGNLSSGSSLGESAESAMAHTDPAISLPEIPEIIVPSLPASEPSDLESVSADQAENADDDSGEGSDSGLDIQSEMGDSEVALEAQHIRQRFGLWAYRIPENVALAFNKRFSDLFN